MFQRLRAAAVAVAGVLTLAMPAYAQDIKIGYNGDQSGSGAAELGISGRHGFEAAIEDLNKAGGIMGRKVVGLIRDDTGQPPKSIQNMTELIENEKVVAIVGPTNSGNALAWLHLPQQRKVPVIVPVATATDITTRYAKEPQNYIFRVSMVDRDQIALMVAYAIKAGKGQKIAVAADSTGFGQTGAKDIKEVLALHGLQAVAVEKFGPKDTDMTSQLAKIRGAGAEVVIVYGLADANAQLLRSMEKINYQPLVLGSWGNTSTPLLHIAGKKLAENNILFVSSTTEDINARAKALAARVRAKYPTMTTFVAAAQAYDAVLMLAAAITQAGGTEGPKVQAALENLKSVPGIIKTYEMPFTKTDHESLSVGDFYLARWKDGQVVRYEDAVTKSITQADIKK